MAERNHNGGPPDTPLTPKAKLECIRGILEREDINSAQKCIGTMMVLQADKDWSSEVRTGELQRAASVKDRETVFRATRRLDQVGVISKESGRGQAGKYTVLPPRVMQAVIEAFDEVQSSRLSPDQFHKKQSGETGRDKQSVPTTNPVGFRPTSSEQSGETGRLSPDQSCARATKELPSEVVISQVVSEESEEKKDMFGAKAPSAGLLELNVFNSYNEIAQRVGLPIARGLAPSRRRSISARLREHGGWPAWEAVLSNIARSAFLQGRNDRNWRPPGLDWFLKPENFTKVFEGAYGNGAHAVSRPIDRRQIEADNAAAEAQGWIIPNQGVTRE